MYTHAHVDVGDMQTCRHINMWIHKHLDIWTGRRLYMQTHTGMNKRIDIRTYVCMVRYSCIHTVVYAYTCRCCTTQRSLFDRLHLTKGSHEDLAQQLPTMKVVLTLEVTANVEVFGGSFASPMCISGFLVTPVYVCARICAENTMT